MSMVFNVARKKKAGSIEPVDPVQPEDLSKNFYFTSTAPFSVGLNDTSTKTWDGTIEYSLDNENWTTFEPATVVNCNNANGGNIFFRGAINRTLSGNHEDDDYAFFKLTGSNVACRGDLTALLNYTLFNDYGSASPSTPIMNDYCLYHLFTNCTSLVEASFVIPSFIQGTQCCKSMFKGCSNLRTPPTINMSNTSNSCFAYMFAGCTALTEAPELNITSLNYACYHSMFKGCSSLVVPPALPLTTLADLCYTAMFDGCTALTSAPSLPASELTQACYNQMFQGCTSLVDPPSLRATIATLACYAAMFKGCISLQNVPIIKLETAAPSCCYQMFQGCTALTVSPYLNITTLDASCCSSMFQDCTSLISPPYLRVTTLAYDCYGDMFNGCTSLATAPELPATVLSESCYGRMFAGCTSLVNAPNLPATVASKNCYREMFRGCTSLNATPSMPLIETAPYCCYQMFDGCTALTTVRALLPKIARQYCYYRMFANCASLTTMPAISATVYYDRCCAEMFNACTSLTISTTSNSEHSARFSFPYALGDYTNACCHDSAFTNIFTGCDILNTITNVDIETNYYTQSVTTNDESLVAEDQTKMFEFIRLGGAFTLKINVITVEKQESWYEDPDTGEIELTNEYTYLMNQSWPGELYYKVINSDQSDDDVNWTLIDMPATPDTNSSGTPIGRSVTINSTDTACGRILLKGKNNNYVSNEISSIFELSLTGSGNNVVCRGNMEILLDADTVEAGAHPPLIDDEINGGFYRAFRNNTRLRSAPALLSPELRYSCYNAMFEGCTALIKPPALPATTLASNCYYSMFEGCTSLIKAPVLSATTLDDSCYRSMFEGCTSLIKAPELSATVLGWSCYEAMFKGCSSLLVPPALPSTNMRMSCYNQMFYNCPSLTALPALPATAFMSECYQEMFASSTSANALISTTKTSAKSVSWRLPYGSGTGNASYSPQQDMFKNRGTIETPSLNTTYYTSAVVLPDGTLVTS